MIEPSRPPGFCIMTFCADLTQPAKMRIVFLVAGSAMQGSLPKLLPGNMTALAWGDPMLAFQNKIRNGVVERFLIQQDDIRFPPLMIGVAGFAFEGSQFFLPAMKSLFSLYVNGHIFMADHALPVLTFLFEQVMTLGTLPLIFRMALDHRARHEELFKSVCARI